MSGGRDQQHLLSGSALTDPEDDTLGYSRFAENLAQTIHGRSPSESIVVGLYAPWGSGKTSILNFTEEYLKNIEDNPVIVRFEPWWFSGEADLVSKFLTQLGSDLGRREELTNIRNRLSKYASAVSNLPLDTAAGGLPIRSWFKAISGLLSKEPEDTEEVKQSISDELKELDKRVYIFVDDIDRLRKNEIKQMFSLINSVADFSNTTYVLAFDYETVSSALEGERGVSDGEEYLDKIIQLAKDIPVPVEKSLENDLADRLEFVRKREDPIFDVDHWHSIYTPGILPAINTPRDAVRLTNAVDSAMLPYSGDINFVDLVCMETLRLFHRDIYEFIRDNPEEFVGARSTSGLPSNRVDYDELFEPYEPDDGELENAKAIVAYLFPRARNRSFTTFSVRENTETYNKRRRICDPDITDYYLRQRVPEGRLGIDELGSLFTLSSENAYASELLNLASRKEGEDKSMANQFLQQASFDNIEHERAFLRGLFIAGDRLIEADPSRSVLDRGSRWLIIGLLTDILESIPRSERDDVLAEAISEGDSVYLPVFYLEYALRQHGIGGGDPEPLEEEQRVLYRSQIDYLQCMTTSKIEHLADENKLKFVPNLDRVLLKWDEWSETDEAREWVGNASSDFDLLFIILSAFLSQSWYSTGNRSGTQLFVDPEYLTPLIDLPTLRQLIEDLDHDELTEPQTEIVHIYNKAFDLYDAGAAVDDPSTWRTSERILDSEEREDNDEESQEDSEEEDQE